MINKELLKGKKIIFDMDGCLYDFSAAPNCSERFWSEEGFFYNLKPIRTSIMFMKQIILSHGAENVFILTKGPDNAHASNDKLEAVKRDIPEFLPQNFRFVRIGKEEKTDFIDSYGVDRKDCILIEDSRKNAEAWEQAGGTSILFNGGTFLPEEVKNGNHYEVDRTFTSHPYITVVNNMNHILTLETL